MKDLFLDQDFLTVSQLNHLVREVISLGFPQALWVCGEVQGFQRNKEKKHVFFDLCEKDPESNEVVAKIGLVIFAGKKAAIQHSLRQAENAFELKDDIEVKFLCKIDFYPPHGSMRLMVEDIDPVYTLGKIAQEKQKLISLLKSKGTLGKNKALEMTPVPLNIGLISAHNSAAYNDFITELKMSGLGFKVYFRNCLMQGKGTEKDVVTALELFQKIDSLDIVVITRGGGSIADLSWFDSRLIAEKIAESRLPVLCGIGHEINITVTDMAAHTYRKTPTAIAQFVVESVDTFLMDLETKAGRVLDLSQVRLKEQKSFLREAAFTLQQGTTHFFKDHHDSLVRVIDLIRRLPSRYIADVKRMVQDSKQRLVRESSLRLREGRTYVETCEKIVEIAKPKNTLKRGFSITRDHTGRLVRSIEDVNAQEAVTTLLSDGSIMSHVDSVEKNKGGEDGGC